MGKWPTGKQETELIRLREEESLSITEIAQAAGVSYSTASFHLNGIIPLKELVNSLPTYSEELLQIRGDCALTSDWHAPYFSMKWLKRLLCVCTKLEIHQLAIVGDLADMKWISHYLKHDLRTSAEQELRIIHSLIQVLLQCFDRVYWSKGNHEDRLLEGLGNQNILPILAELMAKGQAGELITTKAPTIFLNDTWRLDHPKTYSRDAARVASQVAAIFHKNVACAHGHFMGYKHDISGDFVGIDLGGMFDIEKQEYLYMTGATTHPRWNPGFWIYRNGKPEPFDSALVNWKEWGVDG